MSLKLKKEISSIFKPSNIIKLQGQKSLFKLAYSVRSFHHSVSDKYTQESSN